jgi:hypothetical protein
VPAAGLVTQRHCRNCGKTDYNVQTCQEVKEISGTDSCIECTWFFVFVVEQLSLEVGKVYRLLIFVMRGSLVNHVTSDSGESELLCLRYKKAQLEP